MLSELSCSKDGMLFELGTETGQRSNQLSWLATRASLELVKMGAKGNITSVL